MGRRRGLHGVGAAMEWGDNVSEYVQGMLWLAPEGALPLEDRIAAALAYHGRKYGPAQRVYVPAGSPGAPESVGGVPVEPLRALSAGYLLVTPGRRTP